MQIHYLKYHFQDELYEANLSAEIHIYKDWYKKCNAKIEKKISPKLGADLTKLRHDFQVTHLHHSTQRSVYYIY